MIEVVVREGPEADEFVIEGGALTDVSLWRNLKSVVLEERPDLVWKQYETLLHYAGGVSKQDPQEEFVILADGLDLRRVELVVSNAVLLPGWVGNNRILLRPKVVFLCALRLWVMAMIFLYFFCANPYPVVLGMPISSPKFPVFAHYFQKYPVFAHHFQRQAAGANLDQCYSPELSNLVYVAPGAIPLLIYFYIADALLLCELYFFILLKSARQRACRCIRFFRRNLFLWRMVEWGLLFCWSVIRIFTDLDDVSIWDRSVLWWICVFRWLLASVELVSWWSIRSFVIVRQQMLSHF